MSVAMKHLGGKKISNLCMARRLRAFLADHPQYKCSDIDREAGLTIGYTSELVRRDHKFMFSGYSEALLAAMRRLDEASTQPPLVPVAAKINTNKPRQQRMGLFARLRLALAIVFTGNI